MPAAGLRARRQGSGGTKGKCPVATMAGQKSLGGCRRFHRAGAHFDRVDGMCAQLKTLNGSGSDFGGLAHFARQRFQTLEVGIQRVKESDAVAPGRRVAEQCRSQNKREGCGDGTSGMHGEYVFLCEFSPDGLRMAMKFCASMHFPPREHVEKRGMGFRFWQMLYCKSPCCSCRNLTIHFLRPAASWTEYFTG